MDDKELDGVLKQCFSDNGEHIDNDGFAERVMMQLPRRRLGLGRRTAVLAVSGLLPCILLPLLGVDVPGLVQSIGEGLVKLAAAEVPSAGWFTIVALVVSGATWFVRETVRSSAL